MSEAKPEASATTCIVGCKLPHGYKLELFSDPKKTGGVTQVLESFTVKGNNAARIVGGYGITAGVPREFFTEWLRRNAKLPAVVNGAIFMHVDVESAEARAKEGREIRTGIEPIDPIMDARAKGLTVDKEAAAAYRKQQAENPMRNRQHVE